MTNSQIEREKNKIAFQQFLLNLQALRKVKFGRSSLEKMYCFFQH